MRGASRACFVLSPPRKNVCIKKTPLSVFLACRALGLVASRAVQGPCEGNQLLVAKHEGAVAALSSVLQTTFHSRVGRVPAMRVKVQLHAHKSQAHASS